MNQSGKKRKKVCPSCGGRKAKRFRVGLVNELSPSFCGRALKKLLLMKLTQPSVEVAKAKKINSNLPLN